MLTTGPERPQESVPNGRAWLSYVEGAKTGMETEELDLSSQRATGRTPGTRPSARSAAVRGDQYQYALAWRYICEALNDPGVETISVEEPSAGQFDDIAIRRRDDRPDRYFQVKSSNSGSGAIDEAWLTTPVAAAGRSPLQHFHNTWKALRGAGRPFELTLTSNRGIDNKDPILGKLRDNKDARVRVTDLQSATPGSAAGRARARWAAHLGCTEPELHAFLSYVRWVQAGPEDEVREVAVPFMRQAGLRDDDDAVELGIAYVRQLVTDAVGARTRKQLRDDLAARDLFAGDSELVLAVQAIDRPVSPRYAHVRVDWVDEFDGPHVRERHHPANAADWNGLFRTDLENARVQLEAYSTRRLHITGAMRLATHFAVGFEFPEVRSWVLSARQKGAVWGTDAQPSTSVVADLTEIGLDQGNDVAVVVALSHDISEDVLDYARTSQLPVSRVLILKASDGASAVSVPDAGWLAGWVRSARDQVRRPARRASGVHLFMNAPAVAALFLGHQWNTIPGPLTVYDFDQRDYFPTFVLP